MEAVIEFLRTSKIPTEGNKLIETLEGLGVQSLEDLQYVNIDDLSDSGSLKKKIM